MTEAQYEIEFYRDAHGNEPCRRWMEKDLTATQRRALVAALEHVLADQGIRVCGTSFGKHIRGTGIFEFRLNRDVDTIRKMAGVPPEPEVASAKPAEKILLRVFCHAYGNRIILLLGGYDKARDPSPRRQQQEIKVAKKRLANFKQSERRKKRDQRRKTRDQRGRGVKGRRL